VHRAAPLIIGLAVISQLIAFFPFSAGALAEESRTPLRCGWYPWDPYQYLAANQDFKRLTGLDVQLIRAVFGQMGYEVSFDEVS
jgi:hypothetical protein